MLGFGDIVNLMRAGIMTRTINEVEEQGILSPSRSTTLLEAAGLVEASMLISEGYRHNNSQLSVIRHDITLTNIQKNVRIQSKNQEFSVPRKH